jgi:CRP-like cAMP-binding protein
MYERPESQSQGEAHMLKRAFYFLTDEDRKLLVEKAVERHFRKGELILEEGSTRQGLFMVKDGTVRVERSHMGQGVAYAVLGTGEVFGEMSFLDNEGASASVYAKDDCVTQVIDGSDVMALMASVPGFAARFYQSLASMLAGRLRSTSNLVIPLMYEESVPGPSRPTSSRAAFVKPHELSPELVAAVKDFRATMMRLDGRLKRRNIPPRDASERTSDACSMLVDALCRHIDLAPDLQLEIGSYVFRETLPFFMQSRTFERCYIKPRGLAGDYLTMELIHGDTASGDGRLGEHIDRWFLSLPVCKALRNRRVLVTSAARSAAKSYGNDGPLLVSSLGIGTGRELMDFLSDHEFPSMKATVIDTDAGAINFTRELARKANLLGSISFSQENVLRLSLGRGETEIPPQHLVLGTGLADYIEDAHLVRILNWVFDHLQPGGTVVVSGTGTLHREKCFHDLIVDWRLIHRSIDRFREIFSESSFGTCPVDVEPDDTGLGLVVSCQRSEEC